MALSADDVSMALFCDFENIALGVRDAQYEKFDIKPVLERLLLKGSIVVKKAYCDWERYKSFKGAMHEANFELIEIPHVRMSGKNSADIRMVVDALDLCYTKAHVNTFVIISGDSDFSPLVSKLRENAKRVIGVGVKQSTSDLLIANCDEFIYIDDLVRKRNRDDRQARRSLEPVDPQELEARRAKGLEMAAATLEALLEDRADDEKVWASVVKEALKRRHPGFNENYHGFKTFGALLEEAHKRGLLEFGREANSAFVRRRTGTAAASVGAEPETPLAPESVAVPERVAHPVLAEEAVAAVPPAPTFAETPVRATRSRSRSRKPRKEEAAPATAAGPAEPAAAPSAESAPEPAREPLAEPSPAPSSVSSSEPRTEKPARPARKPRAPRRKKTDAPE
jgi:uncharacterized protein (TIGR00288 family)